ncbi:MAG: hypothetical protein AAFY20_16915 [Cyanobacteria bacterium J06639_14]
MTQASIKSLTKPLNFVEFLAWEADGAQYDLLADGSWIEVPEEAEIREFPGKNLPIAVVL